jgi:predicted DNA binding CopG/RHH family protein
VNRARMPKGDVKTSFYLPRRLLRAAKARAARDGISLRALIVAVLEAYLAPNDKEGNA